MTYSEVVNRKGGAFRNTKGESVEDSMSYNR